MLPLGKSLRIFFCFFFSGIACRMIWKSTLAITSNTKEIFPENFHEIIARIIIRISIWVILHNAYKVLPGNPTSISLEISSNHIVLMNSSENTFE